MQKNAPPSKVEKSLEKELQPKLQGPRPMRAIRMQEAGTSEIGVNASTAAAAAGPLRMVKDIESLRTKFESHGLSDLEELKKRHVEIRASRHVKDIATSVAERETSWCGKRASVK